MASFFWVGNGGNWDNVTNSHWATTTGGTGGAGIPTSADDVTFDANSFASSSTVTVASTAACNNLTVGSLVASTIVFSLQANFTASGSCSIQGPSATVRLLIQSSGAGTQRTVTLPTVTALTNVDFADIKGASGLASFTGTTIGDALGNAAITFTASRSLFWVATAGGSWNATTSWSLSTGGASGQTPPLPQDDVTFDANSITATGKTITVSLARSGRNVDYSGVTNSPILTNNANWNCYGNFKAGTFASVSGTSSWTMRGRSAQTLTSAGNAWTWGWLCTASGGSYTLQDDFTTTISVNTSFGLNVNVGTFSANGHNVTTPSMNIGSGTTINTGSGTWTINGANGTVATSILNNNGGTVTTSGSLISITDTSTTTKTFAGGGKSYGAVSVTGGGTGSFTVTGNNTFSTLTIGAPKTVTLPANGTQTVTNLNWHGSTGNLITVQSSLGGTFSTITSSTGGIVCDWLSLSDSQASGTATFWAGANSTSVSHNSGWVFTAPAVTETASMPSAGTVARSTAAAFTPTLSFAGIIHKAVRHGLSSVLSFVGARLLGFMLIAVLSFSASINRVVARTLTASSSFTGLVLKMTFVPFLAILNFTLQGDTLFPQATLYPSATLYLHGDTIQILLSRTLPAAVVSFAGAIAKQPRKALAGGLSSTGRLVRAVTAVLPAVLSFVGSRVLLTARTLTASASFTGTVLRRASRVLTATLTFAGSLARLVGAALTALLTYSGTLAHFITRGLTAALTMAGAITRRATVPLTAAVSYVGNLTIPVIAAVFTAALNMSGALTRSIRRPFSGALSFAGTLARLSQRILAAAVALAGNLNRKSSRILSAVLSGGGTLRTNILNAIHLTAGLVFSGAVLRSGSRQLTASLTSAGQVIRLGGRQFLALLDFTLQGDTTFPSGTLFPSPSTYLTGDTIRVLVSRTLPGASLSFSGLRAARFGRLLTGSLGLTGSIVRAIQALLAGSLPFAGTIRNATTRTLTVLANLAFTGGVTRLTAKVNAATLSFAGAIKRNILALLTSTLSMFGSFSAFGGHVVLFTANLDFHSNISLASEFTLTAVLDLAGSSLKATGRLLSGTLTSAGSLARILSKVLTASVASTGALARVIVRSLSAGLLAVGALVRGFPYHLSADLSFTGQSQRQPARLLLATLTTAGAVIRQSVRELAGVLTLAGAFKLPTPIGLVAQLGFDTALTFTRHMHRVLDASLAFESTIARLIRHPLDAGLRFFSKLSALHRFNAAIVLAVASVFRSFSRQATDIAVTPGATTQGLAHAQVQVAPEGSNELIIVQSGAALSTQETDYQVIVPPQTVTVDVADPSRFLFVDEEALTLAPASDTAELIQLTTDAYVLLGDPGLTAYHDSVEATLIS